MRKVDEVTDSSDSDRSVLIVDERQEGLGDITLPRSKLAFVGDVGQLAQVIRDEIARRIAALPEDHPGYRRGDDRDLDVFYEWLLIECDGPKCNASTELELELADPDICEAPLREVLAGRGWSSDGEGRDLCPRHRPA